MKEADWARVKIPTKPTKVVPTKPVLVPSVINSCDVASKYQQKRRQRTQLIDPHALLQLHPLLDPGRVVAHPPTIQIDHHHARVKVASFSAREGERESGVGPEDWGEVGGEVGVAVLGGGEDGGGAEIGGRELRDVVDEDEVGVEVDDAAGAGGKEGGEVGAGVVEGAVEGGADGGGDEVGDGGLVEVVNAEAKVWE